MSSLDLATELNSSWSLAEAGRYERALHAYDEVKSRGLKLPHGHDANRGLLLLCLKKYEEALAQFREADELSNSRHNRYEGSYLDHIGVAQWLMGRHQDAVIAWRNRVSGIWSGQILYTDLTGGASDGLLLWYAAVTLKDRDLLKYTRDFLHKVSSLGRLSPWPGPLVHLALGATSAEAIMQEHFRYKTLGAWLRGNADMLRRRALVNSVFYSAVNRRADGQEHECQKMMSEVVQMKNPLIELEWYLARGELS